ncbi:MAG: hypothetical protein ACI97A_000465 [Planctomycetota bacterium]|jgi:hypothetical protein
MKIYFCDECHESIPLKDIADNTITIEGGKIYHEKCRPKAAKPGGRVSYSTAAISLLLGLGIGAVVMAIWGDAILNREENLSAARQIARLETTVMDLKKDSDDRLKRIESDLEESPSIDGRAGKLARAFQGIRDNGDSFSKMRVSLNGLGDELRSEQENQVKEFNALKGEREKQQRQTSEFVHQKVVPDLEKAIEASKDMEENISLIIGRLETLEENPGRGSMGAGTGTATKISTVDAPALNPAKAKKRQELLAQLKHKEGTKRFSAAVDLGEFRDREVEEAMVELLQDKEEYVCSTALTNLMDMNTKWSIPHIIPVLKNDDYVLRETAIAALEKLMGRSISLDPAANSAKVLAKIRELTKWWDKNRDRILNGG